MNAVVSERQEKESTKRDLHAVPSIIHLASLKMYSTVVVAIPVGKVPFLKIYALTSSSSSPLLSSPHICHHDKDSQSYDEQQQHPTFIQDYYNMNE